MVLLIKEIQNHDYWIEQVGFDSYTYLLYIREILVILALFSLAFLCVILFGFFFNYLVAIGTIPFILL